MKTTVLLLSLPCLLLTAAASTDPPKTEPEAVEKGRPKPLLTFRGHSDSVHCVRYSPDGKRLATASGDKTAALWDAATGRRLLTLRGHTSWVACVSFSPDGRRLATGGDDRAVRLWETTSDRALRTWTLGMLVSGLAFSPDGGSLAAVGVALRRNGGYHGESKVWDPKTGEERADLRSYRPALSLAYSPDGKRLTFGLTGGELGIVEVATGQEALTLPGHKEAVSGLAYSPDGRRLASACWDGSVHLSDVATGKGPLLFKGHAAGWVALAFSPDGKRLATAGNPGQYKRGARPKGEVRVWHTVTGKQEFAVVGTEPEGGVWSLCFSPCGTRLATAHGDGCVRVWSVEELFKRARPSR
jgi:WD40 repeat protein